MKKGWLLGSRSSPHIAPANRAQLPEGPLLLLPEHWHGPRGPTDSTHRHCLHHQGPHGYQSAFQTKPSLGVWVLPAFACPEASPVHVRSGAFSPPKGLLSVETGPAAPCRPLPPPAAPCRSLPLPAASRHDLPSLVPSCWPHWALLALCNATTCPKASQGVTSNPALLSVESSDLQHGNL